MNEAAKKWRICASVLVGVGLLTAGFADSGEQSGETGQPWQGIKKAVAVVHPTAEGKTSGEVRFEENNDGSVTVTVALEGLQPNQQHAFHVHEYGDCTHDSGDSAGDHYNPGGHPHRLPDEDGPRHAGDLGNLEADQSGQAELVRTVDNLTVAGSNNPVLGRSLIVHAEQDDGGQPSGNAGARIACGVIGVAGS